MAAVTHIPTRLINAQAMLTVASAIVNFADTTAGHFQCGIVTAGSSIPVTASSGIQWLQDIFSTNSELSYSGYARQSLTGISLSYDPSVGVVDWTFNNIVFSQQAADVGNGRYGFIAYTAASGDISRPVVAILDFGQTVSVVNGALTLQAPTTGLIQFAGGG
jgi:hypothetical protein